MKIFLISILFISISLPSYAALTASSCKAKVNTAIQAQTGKAPEEGSFNVLLAICEGIIEEIKTNAVVLPLQFKDAENRPIVGTGKIE